MHIAVLGAGPAGAWASVLLDRRGHSVTLIDAQAPWEKPCGGGVTAKALSHFDIFTSDLPSKNIDRITIYFGDKDSVTVTPAKPIAVLSRRELGKYLLDAAENAGVSILKSRGNCSAARGTRCNDGIFHSRQRPGAHEGLLRAGP